MLALEARFLTGRYVATSYSDRSHAEWPPHPARVFSALVATHYAETRPPPGERDVLDWLASLGAPEIAASRASERDTVTFFVPVNDLTVLGDFEEDVDALDAHRAGLPGASDPKERAKRAKALEKAERKLRDRFARAAQPGRESREDLDKASAALPEARLRQPRTFPSVTPDEPQVVLVWREADPTEEQRQTLDALAARVVRLGHSSTLVSMRVVDDPGSPTWVPSEQGPLRLRVPVPDQLSRLDEGFALHQETQPRVMPAASQIYGRLAASGRPADDTMRSEFTDDWLVFRRAKGGPTLPITTCAAVARAMRGALLKHAVQPPPEMLTGHREERRVTDRTHLAIVPLPFVGGGRADGSITGVALVLPRGVGNEDRRAVFGAVAAWEAWVREERPEHAADDAPPLALFLGRAGSLELVRMEESPGLRTLDPGTWCRAARRWLSATPVALDRNPGELRHRDSAKARAAFDEAEATICSACVRIGLPEPTVTVQFAAPLAGSANVRHWPSYPPEKERTWRVLVHAALDFERPVMGPILLGAGRYLGLGLFRPEHDHG
ncbi:MAG: type I-U CRISPR-associated protein Csb2 [Myxococcota bacterium]|nr:type I-U CRISPR-associated protein Csb2 [Myxococcota bacterium]